MRVAPAPFPGLVNCLAASPSATHISALTAHGQLVVPCRPSPQLDKFSIGPVAAIAHACTSPHVFVHVRDNFVYVTSHIEKWQYKIPFRLHFDVRQVAIAQRANSFIVVVGGFDGAYVAYVAHIQPHTALHLPPNPESCFLPLPGSEGFAVVHVAIADDAIAVVLIDGRVALWADVSSPAVTILNAMLTVSQSDRITDVEFTPSGLILAYWSGTIAYYTRVLANVELASVFDTYSSKSEEIFYQRGATVIACSPLSYGVALCVIGDGILLFIRFEDEVIVKKAIQCNGLPALVKGVCTVDERVFVWVVDSPDLVSLSWPSSQQFDQALKLKEERESRKSQKPTKSNARHKNSADASDNDHNDVGDVNNEDNVDNDLEHE